MKLFDDFEAIKFVEEDLILITSNGYLYYIYNPKYDMWSKYRNAGNDHLNVSEYDDVSKNELIDSLGGIFPQRETDFMRLCDPRQLWLVDMLELLCEEYPDYMSNSNIYYVTHHFLLESDLCAFSYDKLRKVFDAALVGNQDNEEIMSQILELSLAIIGRDIFRPEIGIVDGHDTSSYFWIMPVRILDNADTSNIDFVAEMRSSEISIEEDDVGRYLMPFLCKYFDEELDANKNRLDANGFEWYLTYNYFTFDSIAMILEDINDTIEALNSGKDNEYTENLKENRGEATNILIYSKDMTQEQIDEYNTNRPTEDVIPTEMIVDFYRRFVYRMEYMIQVGKENGYNLISFMGP